MLQIREQLRHLHHFELVCTTERGEPCLNPHPFHLGPGRDYLTSKFCHETEAGLSLSSYTPLLLTGICKNTEGVCGSHSNYLVKKGCSLMSLHLFFLYFLPLTFIKLLDASKPTSDINSSKKAFLIPQRCNQSFHAPYYFYISHILYMTKLMLIKYFLCVMQCSKCFTYIDSFNFHHLLCSRYS